MRYRFAGGENFMEYPATSAFFRHSLDENVWQNFENELMRLKYTLWKVLSKGQTPKARTTFK